jgi:selenocysteine lyase/cysteine desulfurase
VLRISAQLYNRVEDYERLAAALVESGVTPAPAAA